MPVPQTLGKYEIRHRLGRGSMGTVHQGWDTVLERLVAIKTMHFSAEADSEEIAEQRTRFHREARTAASLIHPNIAIVHDYGESDGTPYIVMEFVDGQPLKELLAGPQRLALPRIAAIMEDLLSGLGRIHAAGAVHRDIKPANLMLTSNGQMKIVDFGIARIEGSTLTMTGFSPGTLAYMSPEQRAGRQVDWRSDLCSSGMVLYEMLTGQTPLDSDVPGPSLVSKTAPAALDAVVLKAMARLPGDRYQSAEAFAAALKAALVPPEAGDKKDTGSKTPDTPGRRKHWLLAGSAALAVAVGLVAYEPVVPALTPAPDPVKVVAQPPSVPPPVPSPPEPVRLVAPTSPPTPAILSVIRDFPAGPELVLLPEGSFTMGIPEAESKREGSNYDDGARPLHPVTIPRRFYMGKFTVTRGEYAAFIAEKGERPAGDGCYGVVQAKDGTWSFAWKKEFSWRDPGFSQDDRHPAVCVSHEDAEAYVAWLSGKTGKSYRLPSEAEWEYAARAVTSASAPFLARYWGNDRGPACAHANVSDATLARQSKVAKPDPEQYFACDDKFAFTAPVGSFKPNAFGLHDVLGNVRQRTRDCWHDSYKDSPPTDGSAWATTGDCGRRVLRGASWYYNPGLVRAGIRGWGDTGDRGSLTGFRVARTY